MRNFIFLFLICVFYQEAKTQSIVQVKDTVIRNTSTDSMYYINYAKIISFKDSGVVVVGYADSVVNNIRTGWRVVVTAFDKNLNTLWSRKFSFAPGYSSLPACVDSSYNIYFTCFNGSLTSLIKLSPDGSVMLSKLVEPQISSNIIFINSLSVYYGRILLSGNIYNSSTSFSPFIALFDMTGNLYKKKIFPAKVGPSTETSQKISMLNITPENNISITYQDDTLNNYAVDCYDSSFSQVWHKILNIPLGYTYNLFNQGNNVVFINMEGPTGVVSVLKYDSKTGTGGARVDHTYNFNGLYTMFVLPTGNGKYLNFGNYVTSGGFDNAIDYFDDNALLGYVASNTMNSRNRVSSACIIGNSLYTVAIRFVDQYCYPTVLYGYRGMLWIKKFNTDFLTQTMDVKELSNNNDELKVWPNPFSDEIFMNGVNTSNDLKVMIYDQLGNSIQVPQQLTGSSVRFDTGLLAKGIYFVSVSSNGDIKRSKMLKF